MSKKLRIIIAIIVIIILGVAGFFIAKKIEQENRKYNIENISEYNYFVIKEDNKYGIMDKEGKTIICVTHDEKMAKSADRIIDLKKERGSEK